ncbi:hypothetical protein V8E54_005298 [Elaphomyces granulatus]
MYQLKRIWALTVKNILLALVRRPLSTPLRAFILPVIFTAFISFARNLFIPPSIYGIGTPTPVQSFSDALNAVSGGRNKVAFVNNGFTGGDIQRVISQVAGPVQSQGKQINILSLEDDLQTVCRNSIRGVSTCVAAVVFYSSPNEGPGGRWNYSLRTDGALGVEKINVDETNNDAEIYALPLQHAVDWAIANGNTSIDQSALPAEVIEYPYTSLTEQGRQDRIRMGYADTIISALAVAIFIGMVGITYQLPGLVASEREVGITQLVDCMIPAPHWQAQAARFIATHLAFDLIYTPGWVITALILRSGIYTTTSAGIMVVFNLLTGLALSSFSLFGASFFKKAQLSGISVAIACLLLGIVSQVVAFRSNGAVIILGLLFPPMNYVFFSKFIAHWEKTNQTTSITKSAPENTWSVPAVVFLIFLALQTIAYPILGAIVEQRLYGTSSKSRRVVRHEGASAVRLEGFTKIYEPNWIHKIFSLTFRKPLKNTLAVNDLTLNVMKGQITVLLGANGSGKSTTLDGISGLMKMSSGQISIDYGEGSGGLGICPQKNVLWDSLTVKEHVRLFNRLKTQGQNDTETKLLELIRICDLGKKAKSLSKALSGGQKRKLQLALMFTGESSICCVDEVSSGLDPISRRKIWDILLAERGARTILLTTHFLDEADLLADHIAILSKGTLKTQGTSVELKHQLGSGYRIHVYHVPGSEKAHPQFEDIPRQIHFDETVYTVEDTTRAIEFISILKQAGINEYRVSGPTIEDVFLKVAEEVTSGGSDLDADNITYDNAKVDKDNLVTPQLLTGRPIGVARQALILFSKRATILRRNYLPYLFAFLIPVIAAGLVSLFVKSNQQAGCSPDDSFSTFDSVSLSTETNYDIVLGPSHKLSPSALSLYASSLSGSSSTGAFLNGTANIHIVDNLPDFNNYISNNFANVTPGGFYLGDSSSPPTFAWFGDSKSIATSTVIQNALDSLLTNISISYRQQPFDVPWQPDVGNYLELITYFGLVMAVYPAFFGLYPTAERLKHVRDLHYSNGVRTLPLWLAYTLFDFCIVLISTVLMTIIFRAVSDVWYHLEYLFVVFFLYGLTSTAFSYLISLLSKSQLSAFAITAGGQCVMFILYFIAYMSVLTYAPVDKIDSYVNITHFAIATVMPIGNLVRSLFVTLNVFSLTCRDRQLASYPGEITLYGGPILYLIVQFFLLFGLLLWIEGGPRLPRLRARFKLEDFEQMHNTDEEVTEIERVSSSNDGLRVLHVTKAFGKSVAVEDVTFGVRKGEVFALLGPNGAGKTTTISLIRGDLRPSGSGGDIFVENVSVLKNRAAARLHLGVCPQFDAIDQMSVREHLRFYAQVRGVSDVNHNVHEVLRAVGLTPYADRMAAKLSGGNKRKLSLGIALMGNPTVLLLDEPSSGMDAAAKRVIWRTLSSVVPGRALVLTTHSMEEADALANRAGIMSRRMLALGSAAYLRRKYGNMYHVHLIHREAPHTTLADMDRLREWVKTTFPGSEIEQKTYHGQLRFSVPTTSAPLRGTDEGIDEDGRCEIQQHSDSRPSSGTGNNCTRDLFVLLERNKDSLGFQYYSISQTSLDQVFLTIVGMHNVQEAE